MTRKEIRAAKRAWVLKNRGVMAEIAGDLEVTKSWVSQVFYNEIDTPTGELERRLHAAGAPFMEDRVQGAA